MDANHYTCAGVNSLLARGTPERSECRGNSSLCGVDS